MRNRTETIMAKQTLGQRIAPARFLAFLAIFATAFVVQFGTKEWPAALMISFDIATAVFLVSVAPLLHEHDATAMRQHAAENDANRVMLLVISTVVSVAVLTAIGSEAQSKTPPKLIIVATLALAWLFSNTVYALHYAHIYYVKGSKGGLGFSGKGDPDYGDFIYFAYTLGMTFQTSDTAVETPSLRRVVTAHSFAAFVFNIGVLAFTINVLGSH
jgi:uncharacterized membrane protein